MKTLVGPQSRKILPLIDVKATTDGNGGFEGYGSIFGNIDSYGDIVLPGAFKGTIDKFLSDGFASVGHAWSDLPVATFNSAHEDEKGLWVSAEFHSDDFSQRARTVTLERIARGKSVGLSIGFSIKQGGAVWANGEDGYTPGIRLLKDLDLFEVAIVNVPANPQATAVSAKSHQSTCADTACGCRLRSTEHEGLKFADHGEALLGELRGFSERAKAIANARATQQRVPSEDSMERVTALVTELKSLTQVVEGLLTPVITDTDREANRKSALAEIARYEILRSKTILAGVV